MREKQKTLESFLPEDRAEPEDRIVEARSMDVTESVGRGPYLDLMRYVIDDDNIDKALKQVVGNRGAPGVDGMTVFELEPWLRNNREEFKDMLVSGRYVPTPVRRKEIPKDNGGVRKLGIPTVCDRLVQQMIAQVLEPLYDPTFSDSSFGFRPDRSAIQAVTQEKEYYEQGYTYAVGIDMEKFFDTLQHDFIMNILRERIKDKTLILLIKRFLRAGIVLPNGLVEPSTEGAPQGGPLSPLLSNIYLDKLDKELEARGLHFCRYADDSLIMVRTPRAAERVCESVTRYIEEELKLRVNREKTEIGSPRNMKFLGFKLTRVKDGIGLTPHPKAVAKFKRKVIAITKRNRGVSFEQVIEELNQYTRGWMGYFGITSSDNLFKKLDEWIRRRVRQFLFKSWKKRYNRFRKLKSLCPEQWKCPDGSITLDWVRACWSTAMRGSYWQASNTLAMKQGVSNRWLSNQGMYFLVNGWNERHRQGVPTAGCHRACPVV